MRGKASAANNFETENIKFDCVSTHGSAGLCHITLAVVVGSYLPHKTPKVNSATFCYKQPWENGRPARCFPHLSRAAWIDRLLRQPEGDGCKYRMGNVIVSRAAARFV